MGDAMMRNEMRNDSDPFGTGSEDAKGDWIDGGVGNDVLIGSAAKDVLIAGLENDLLIGGAGDDLLLGKAPPRSRRWRYGDCWEGPIYESTWRTAA